MDTKTRNITYQFRVYMPRCETYAVRLEDCKVTGVYGPMEYQEVLCSSLPNFDYEDDPIELDWVKANLCDFTECDSEYDENVIRI